LATQQELHQVIGRLVADEAFRQEFEANPEEALKRIGVTLSPEQLRHLNARVNRADLTAAAQRMRLVCGDTWPSPTP